MAGKEGVGPTGRNWKVRGGKLQNWMVLDILRDRKLEIKKEQLIETSACTRATRSLARSPVQKMS